MKNLHVVATDKPSRIKQEYTNKASYVLSRLPLTWRYAQHIYITNSEEIKEGDFVYSTNEEYNIQKVPSKKSVKAYRDCGHYKKIILTTDLDLIEYGVQSVDDEFLNWFVNNPTCEEVEVENSSVVKEHIFDGSNDGEVIWEYKVIIPKEEPKQETLEEVAEILVNRPYGNVVSKSSFIEGAKYQAERMYSEEDMKKAFQSSSHTNMLDIYNSFEDFIEQFKKK